MARSVRGLAGGIVGGGGGKNQETWALVLTLPLMLLYVQQGQDSLLYLKTSQPRSEKQGQ